MKHLIKQLVFGGLLGLTVVIALLFYSDVRSIGVHVRTFPPPFILPVLCLTLFNYVLRWIKWHYYLRVIGVQNISLADSMILWVAGFVLALSPGKAAELLKAAVLQRMTGMPAARGMPVVIAERVTDGLAMLILGTIGFGSMLLTPSAQHETLMAYVPAYLVVLSLLIGGVLVLQIQPLFKWLIACAERLPLVGDAGHALRDLYESGYALFRPRPLIFAVALGVVSWAGECVGFFCILWGMGLSPSWLLLWQAVFILASATIIGAVSGLPGGLGAAEFTIAGMLQLLVLGYEDPGFAGTATILMRIFTLWFAVALGLLTAFAFRWRLFYLEET